MSRGAGRACHVVQSHDAGWARLVGTSVVQSLAHSMSLFTTQPFELPASLRMEKITTHQVRRHSSGEKKFSLLTSTQSKGEHSTLTK